jgi:hypothetical protein
LALSRVVFQVRRHGAGRGGERRHHPGELVGGFAQPLRPRRGVLNRP